MYVRISHDPFSEYHNFILSSKEMDPDSQLDAAVRSLSLKKQDLVNVTLVCESCGHVLYMDDCRQGVFKLGEKPGWLCTLCRDKQKCSFYEVTQISCKLHR